MKRNIVLIGFMATGKTATGRRLALRLGRQFIDTDAEVERITGRTIAQIFARDGAIRFRAEEALLVKKLAQSENLVISTGGGLVLNSENVCLLKEKGVLIALRADPEVIYQRVKNKKNRPLLLRDDVRKVINGLLKEREGVYEVAEYAVDTGKHSLDEVVNMIISYLYERNYI